MNVEGWKYYNYAAIPTTEPHEKPNTAPIDNGSIWKIKGGTPLLASWITDFDCGNETNWWYCIKDNEYDIQSLKAKRRYEITKARKNFKVEIIRPDKYCKEIFDVLSAAYSAYPKKYRPVTSFTAFKKDLENWDGIVFAAFSIEEAGENGLMCGYAYVKPEKRRLNFIFQKTRPNYEKLGVNAALVDAILLYFNDLIRDGGKYISDGQRSVNHETAFQDYLEKYFGFRKAYCHLHIAYNPRIKYIVKFLYPMRKLLFHLDGMGMMHQVCSVLKMEEFARGNNE